MRALWRASAVAGKACADATAARIKSGVGRRISPESPLTPRAVPLALADREITLAVRRSNRARRVALRVDPAAAEVELVLPWRTSLAAGLRFAASRAGWVAQRLAQVPPRIAFADGVVLPVLGEDVSIRHHPRAGGPARREGAALIVAGRPEHLERRVRDWLTREARRVLWERTRIAAAKIERRVASIRLGDPKTRWGSCSAKAGIAYSWRLILAPPAVLDYVVAHEVAHLVELNHGARFWRLVERLAGDARGPRAWLRINGPRLLRYG